MQVKLRDLAARNSSSKRRDRCLMAAASLLSQYMSSCSRGVASTLAWPAVSEAVAEDLLERELEIDDDQSKK